MVKRGIHTVLHYLDDFMIVAESWEEACQGRDLLLQLWKELGVPIEESKLEGPSRCLEFLGIEVDVDRGRLRLPREKMECLVQAQRGPSERCT